MPLIIYTKDENKGDNSLLHDSKRMNMTELTSVSKRLVFVRDVRSNSFSAKLQICNRSHRFVSYKLRSTDKLKFSIKPGFGFIQPGSSCEVTVSTTKRVQKFDDITKDSFCLFVVPIYDKRRLEKKSLSALWQVHGTNIFPYTMTEVHHIPYVLPKSDNYFDNLSLLERLGNLNHVLHVSSLEQFTKVNNEEMIDEEAFHLNWSPKEDSDIDPTMEGAIADYRILAMEMRSQTKEIMRNAKATLGAVLCALFGILMLICTYYWGTINYTTTNDRRYQQDHNADAGRGNFLSPFFWKLFNWWN